MNNGKFKNNKRGVRTVLIVLGNIVLIAIIVLLVNTVQRHTANNPYCESIDPTGCSIDTRIYNDTSSLLTVKQCEDNSVPCKSFAEVATLRSGMSYKANGSTDGTPQPWLVLDRQSKLIGCLNLDYTKYQQPPVTASLSKLSSRKKVSDNVTKFKKKYHAF